MGSIKQKKRDRRVRRQVKYHKTSMIAVSSVVVLMAVLLSIGSISLRAKNNEYKRQEQKLKAQIAEQEQRQEEIEALKEYVGTDEYIEDVAKEKLRLVNPNEILFEAEP